MYFGRLSTILSEPVLSEVEVVEGLRGGEFMKNNILIIIVVVALVVGAGGFFAGMKYQESKSPTGRFGSPRGEAGNFQGVRNGNFEQRAQGLRPVNGEIISSDDKSITVKLQDGSSKIVLLNDTTTFSKSAEGSKSDLKTGEKVAVFGTENSDGSVTAQSVQLNPQIRVFNGSTPSGSPR
ncbi:MAG: hypothetical protein UW37_C0040G0007 [Candidatus Gottesmanbacteria bacterium GW2011_GWA2_44_17]|uniref:DUF5666 domain-containing protein n=2 Tax=Microgenomates group TaxID=1794810 RepID=A0A0G1HH09_9BACT|nr:MAG: hypothetical protein UW37_C0040G0007 [Candidatus Gottesmanbacteria bacterium GW2011_GWA2_44_17]